MAALSPIHRIMLATVVLGLSLTAVAGVGAAADVLLGLACPALVASGAWVFLERVQRMSPERSMRAMVGLFMAKMIVFGAYIAALLTLGLVSPVPFVVSFGVSFLTLHLIQAMELRRLFASRL
jgi:hypothetical protein